MRQRFGLPYMGSKEKFAAALLDSMPSAGVFHDLFAGGCAVAHAALLSGKYDRVAANDVTDTPELFKRILSGEFRPPLEWVSRERFEREKETSAFIRVFWSFSNDSHTYLYGRDKEERFHAMFEFVVNRDDTMLRGLFRPEAADKIAFVKNIGDMEARRLAVLRVFGGSEVPDERAFSRVNLLERLARVRRMTNPRAAARLSVTRCDYKDVPLGPDSICYCDIPYKGTHKYPGARRFDYEAFCDWARSRDFPVYISEYWMPEDFLCVWDAFRISTMSAHLNNTKAVERLFVHKKWEGYLGTTFLFNDYEQIKIAED